MTVHRFQPSDQIPGFDSGLLATQHADEHLAVSDGDARCSLWWKSVPPMEGECPGVIGHFHAASATKGALILTVAFDRLRQQGCTIAIGPMDGNTWRRYRVLTERGTEPVFFMEPDNPDWWKDAFEKAQFSPLATYSSSLVEDPSKRDPRAERTSERLMEMGVTIRNLDPNGFISDLRRIHKVSIVSFGANYLYTGLSEDAFLAQYTPYRNQIRPEFVFLAEYNGTPVGYLFAIPDYSEKMRGEPTRTIVGKTLAILPERRYGGLGVVLMDLLHQRTLKLGFERVIHALQHDANNVRNMSGFFGRTIRRYTLYSRRIA